MIKSISFLAISCLLFTSHAYAGQALNEDLVEVDSIDSETNLIDSKIDLIESEINLIEQQRRRDREEKERQIRAEKLETYRDKVLKEIHSRDVKLYRTIQKLAREFYAPVFKHHVSHGGYSRYQKAVVYLNELYEIHRTEELGSEQKVKRLFELINNMKRDLEIFKGAKILRNDIEIPFSDDEQRKVTQVVHKLLQGQFPKNRKNPIFDRKRAKSIGGSIGLDYACGLGIGASCGWTKDPLGERHVALFGQGYGEGLGVGPSMSLGYYSYEVEGKHLFGVLDGITGGLGIEGSIYDRNLMNRINYSYCGEDYPVDLAGMEGGVGISLGLRKKWFLGYEICPLPTDWKMQRKHLGLYIEEAKHPYWLCNGNTIEEVKASYERNKEEYRGAKKRYSGKTNPGQSEEVVE